MKTNQIEINRLKEESNESYNEIKNLNKNSFSIEFLVKYISIYRLLKMKILEYLECIKDYDTYKKIFSENSRIIEENTLLVSFGIGLIDYDEYNKIDNDWKKIRNKHTISHAFNDLTKSDEKLLESIDIFIEQIENRKIPEKKFSDNLEEIKSVLFFYRQIGNNDWNVKNAYYNKSQNDKNLTKKFVDFINKGTNVFNFFCEWIHTNYKNNILSNNLPKIYDILDLLDDNVKTKILQKIIFLASNAILRNSNDSNEYIILEIFDLLCENDIVKKNINLLDESFDLWKKSQRDFYQFSEVNKVLSSNVIKLLINEKWIKMGGNNKAIDFYRWILVGNKCNLIAFDIWKYEKYLLDNALLQGSLYNFYEHNKEYIELRRNLDKRFSTIDNQLNCIFNQIKDENNN